MINKELKSVMDYMEREKGLQREVVIDTIVSSLQSAARKSVRSVPNPIIDIDPKTFSVAVFEKRLVISDEQHPRQNEILLSVAQTIQTDAKVDDEVLVEITPKNFGRIAAQTAKQVMIQKLREAEASVVFNEYKDKAYSIVSGAVRLIEGKNIIIDLGRGEALLKHKERIENEEYRIGDRLKLIIIEVKKHSNTPEILVSRSHPLFVKKLFEIEVPEINDQTVEIKCIAREAGYRTKIAVFSKDPKVDCVGSCVGIRGSRVKNIVQELNGEKIDIVPWSPEIITFCRNAMNPAKLKHITIDEENKKLTVYVDKSQFSLAIGKKGYNARLTSKLIGWKVDVEVMETDTPIVKSKEKKSAADNENSNQTASQSEFLDISIDEIECLSKKIKEHLVFAGYKNLSDLKNIDKDDLYTIPGVGKTQAEEILETINEEISKRNG